MKYSSLCYITRGDEYLLLHRIKKSDDENAGKWIGFGGKFEDRESPEDCVKREVYEETGLTLTEFSYRGIVTFVSDRWETEYMHLFLADGFTGELKECDEGVPEWIKKTDFAALPQWEGDRIFISLMESDCPFFSLKLEYIGEELTGAWLNGRPLTLPYNI
ncbi:MAG: 8-oxo-dGTP diphosphatase [Clostridia bacterium]|nr:8-oxo-dGTP diphosphatase [Clostridia bacterium]